MVVARNDALSMQQIVELNPDRILISPGPGYPIDAGISCQIIREFAGKIPIGGICLGMQCMVEVFGGEIIKAGEIFHGKQSSVNHDRKGMFQHIESPVNCIRYHSLIGNLDTLPSVLEITSTANKQVDGQKMIMGVRHKTYAIEGVQFHPESILTENGMKMMQNFLLL